MIILFWLCFLATGFFVRILTHLTHNPDEYPHTRNLTGYLRKFTKKERGFANFFVNASVEEKKRVFRIVAEKSNEDQRRLVESVGGKL